MVAGGLTCLASIAVAAPQPATPAAGLATTSTVPTCLIVNGGGQGGMTKSTACAEVEQSTGSVAYGSYRGPSPTAAVIATATLQASENPSTPTVFTTLSTATSAGVGQVSATTAPRHATPGWVLRACVTAGVRNVQPAANVCTGVS